MKNTHFKTLFVSDLDIMETVAHHLYDQGNDCVTVFVMLDMITYYSLSQGLSDCHLYATEKQPSCVTKLRRIVSCFIYLIVYHFVFCYLYMHE